MDRKTPNFDALIGSILDQLNPGKKTCEETGEAFEITDQDISMYRSLRIPPPKTIWWARERRMYANTSGFQLFRRVLSDGQSVVTLFDPESPATILPLTDWYSDRYDPLAYGRSCDPDRSFFDQWQEFSHSVPRTALLQDPKSENSEWTIYGMALKNCYMTHGGLENQDLLYSIGSWRCKFGSENIISIQCEWCYACVSCNDCSHARFCERCDDCFNIAFCFGCKNCTDCFGCTNLRNQRFCFLNEPLTEDEYRRRVAEVDLTDARVVADWTARMRGWWDSAYRKGFSHQHSERVVGSEITESRDVQGIWIVKSERVYGSFEAYQCKDSINADGVGLERCSQVSVGVHCYENRATVRCVRCMEVEYSEELTNCEYCFGCIGLRNKSFCIFNRQYSEADYWPLVDRLKTEMLRRGEYGEFFPYRTSLIAYNNSAAGAYDPLTPEQVKALSGRWYAFPNEDSASAEPIDAVPERLADTPDSITQRLFRCPETGRAFRYVKQEIALHRQLGIALPRRHPTVRFADHMRRLLPFRLYERRCDLCEQPMQTRIPPTHRAPVYCQTCYEAVTLGQRLIPGVH